jgi:hypothetical protein
MKEEQIRNVAKIFEAFARAVSKKENIKIEALLDGTTEDGWFCTTSIDINKSNNLKFSFDSLGNIDIRENGDLRFNSNITDIQSVTTFRATKLKFSETNKK